MSTVKIRQLSLYISLSTNVLTKLFVFFVLDFGGEEILDVADVLDVVLNHERHFRRQLQNHLLRQRRRFREEIQISENIIKLMKKISIR